MAAAVSVLVSLIVMVFLIRKRWPLYLAIWTALPAMVLINTLDAAEILQVTGETLASRVTHNLLLAILGIGILGEMLYLNGSIDNAMEVMKEKIRDRRYLIATLPAFIGLMPVPGGAYLSAPLVKKTGEELEMDPLSLTLANIFFRHIFYFIFPLYPGMVAFLEMSGVPLYYLLMFTLVPFLVAVLQSFMEIFKGVQPLKHPVGGADNFKGEKEKRRSAPPVLVFLYSLLPIITALVISLVLNWPFHFGLGAGVIIAFFQNINHGEQVRFGEIKKRVKGLARGVKFNILLTILGILFFKELVSFTNALEPAAEFMRYHGVPIILIALVFPYLTGLATGNQIAAVGVSLPIIIPMVPAGSEGWPCLGLVYVSSLMGYMVSPLHLCAILTVDCFKVTLHKVIYRLQVMSLGVLLVSLLMAWGLRSIIN